MNSGIFDKAIKHIKKRTNTNFFNNDNLLVKWTLKQTFFKNVIICNDLILAQRKKTRSSL